MTSPVTDPADPGPPPGAWRGRLLSAWVDGARRRAGWIALASALFTVACTLYMVRELGVETDTEAIFDEDLPFRVVESRLDAAFPMLEDAVFIVLDASSAERAEDAAERLAERLASQPDLYADVFVPGGGPFFARNGLLYRDLDDLEDLVDRLAAAQPFLAEVSRDPSLRGLFRIFERALERADAEAARGLDLEAALADVERSVREAAALRVHPLAFDELIVGSDDGARRYVLVQPRIDYTELVPATEAMDRLRETLTELGFGAGAEVRARFTGNLALSQEELEITRRQASLAGLASFVMVTGILFVALRSVRMVLATAAALAAGLLWTGAFAAFAIGHLNMISVGFAVLFIGLGVDFGIHFCMRYRELRGHGEPHAEALRETASGVGGSLALCAVTTATGFFAFSPTGYRGVAELGVIAGTGMFVSLFAALTLLPALLSVGGGGAAPVAPLAASPGAITPRFTTRRPGLVLAVAVAVGATGAVLAPRLGFDGNPLRVRDPGADTVQVFAELVEEGDVNPWTAEVLAPSLEAAAELSGRLAALPEVDRSVTLLDYVPADQVEKRALLADARMLLHLTPPARRRAPPGPEEERAALADLQVALADFLEGAPPSSLREGAARVAHEVEDFVVRLQAARNGDAEGRLAALNEALVSPIARGLVDLERALAPEAVTLETLPEPLRRRLLAPDGSARVQAFPVEDLNDNRALEDFVAAVRSVAPDATGDGPYLLETGRTIVGALQLAFAAAAGVILVVLLGLWRSVRDTALVLAPIGLATLTLVGVSVAAGMPLNFANVIVLPLLLGIGVDSGIHMVHRHRSEGAEDLLATSTPRAVWWSALTTVASFGSLGLATHRGMASLGQLLVLGVVLTVMANLVVLPALLEVVGRRRR